MLFFLYFNHAFLLRIDCNQYTRDPKHEGRIDRPERRGRGVAFVTAKGGLVRAQGDGANCRIYTQEATGGGHYRACSCKGRHYVQMSRARYRNR